jgi:phosphoglucosamine mutase
MGKYFGTDGIRGLVGEYLTASIAYRVGRYLGNHRLKRNLILIGMDTRISSSMLTASLIAGITSTGSDVVNVGVISTPAISYFLQNQPFDFGIMVSASHNPFYDNGIKIFNAVGEKLEADIEAEIEQYIDGPIDSIKNATGQAMGRVIDAASNYHDQYINFLVKKASFKTYPLKILVDCANGSTYQLIKDLFVQLGIEGTYIHDQPNGININAQCGATCMPTIQQAIKEGQYDLGISFDGDGDRMLAVTQTGKIVDGDALLYLHGLFTLPKFPEHQRQIVMTQMSNYALKKAFKDQGIHFIETQVGDKYVQAALKQHDLIIGGEQSGHIIFLNDLNTGSGLLSAIKLLNIILEQGKTLDELVLSYSQYPQVLRNLPVPNKEQIMGHPDLLQLIQKIELSLKDQGRILVRPSGTESLIRIMVEAQNQDMCQQYVEEVAQFILHASL